MSKPLELITASVVSLTIGVLIGAQLFGDLSPTLAGPAALEPERAASDPVSNATRPQDPLTGSGSPLIAVTSTAVPARLPAAAAPAERPPPPAEALEASEPGTRSIAGTVVTLSGAPLAGVELELEPPRDAPKYRVRTATSDADGRFEFTGLPDGVWDITGEHPEYVLQRRTSYPTRIPTGASVEFLASPGIAVEVHVVGAEADRARVAYRRENDRGEPTWSSWSPDEPRITLGPGAWSVCAFVDPLEDWPSDRGWKLAPLASVERTVQVGIERPEPVTLTLESVSCLYGEIVLPAGHQGGGSRPQVRLVEPQDGTRDDFESVGDRTVRNAGVDDQGRYGFFRLPYERWTAGIALNWSSPSTAEVVEAHGLTRVDFDRLLLDREESVVVDAFTPAGHRITEGIWLSFLHRDAGDDPDEYLWQHTRTVLEEGGSLRVIPLPMDVEEARKAAKKQELVLRAYMAGFATIEQPLAGLDGERYRLTFAASADLTVMLVGEGGLRAMRKANAQLDGERFDAWTGFDEAEEALEFTGVHPGSYTLTVSTWTQSGEDYRHERLHHGPVDVRPGSQRLEIAMPTRSDLVVRCPGVKKDVEAYLSGIDEDRTRDEDEAWGATYAQARVDERGEVRFEGMIAGTYRLTIGSRVQLVRIPSAALDFEGVLPERYMFRLEKGDSPLRRAGVRSGDVLVAIDGERLSVEATEKRLEVLSSQSDGTATLTVERAGREIELTLDAADLDEEESFSASLEPDLGGG